jgi:hypothetical protein
LQGFSVTISQSAPTPFSLTFLSQQGLQALPNPRVTFGRCFGDDFPVGYDSVFVDYFLVNRGCERFRIKASLLEGFSVTISQLASTPFSLTFSESKGAGSYSESTRHL